MKSEKEIKEECLIAVKNMSNFKLKLYIFSLKVAYHLLCNELFFWLVSVIIFSFYPIIFICIGILKLNLSLFILYSIGHLIFWYFKGNQLAKEYVEDLEDEEILKQIAVLIELKNIRKTKK